MAEIVIIFGIFVIHFLHCGSLLCEWPAATVVDLEQELPAVCGHVSLGVI